MKKVFIYYKESYCIRRALDASKIFEYLKQNKYTLVDNPKDSDLILFITCASLDSATEFSLKKIREFQRYKAELIVAGCLPAIDPDDLKKIFNGRTLVTKDIDNISEIFPKTDVDFSSIEDANQTTNRLGISDSVKGIFCKSNKIKNLYTKLKSHIIKNIFGQRSRFYKWAIKKDRLFIIRVSWGCSRNCSYCGIKNAIGPYKSKPLDVCIKEFKKGLVQGYSKFVINADDIGAYGLDIKSSFDELLDKLTDLPGDYKLSILDLSPIWAIKYSKEIANTLKRGRIDRIDIPIQSGNERILKLMNRYSDLEKIKQVFKRFKEAYEPLIIDTRLILGFPSETEMEFMDTLRAIREIDFFSGYIYPFSLKRGTEAYKIEPKISKKEMKHRAKIAKKYLKKLGYNFIKIPTKQFYLFEKK